jgi:hypothetical protein
VNDVSQASGDLSERAEEGLRLCQQHAAAVLAPWYMQWQARG